LLSSKNKIRILVADNVDLSGLKLLPKKYFIAELKLGITNTDILKHYNDYEILALRSTRKIDRNFLSKCGFKIIASFTKGLDHIDLQSAKEKNIKIINSESGNTVSAAEHTFGLILAIYKNIFFSDSLVRKNKFSYYDFKRTELRGKKIGIIGFGKVGSRVAKYANAFEMKIIANDIDKKVREKNRKYDFRNLDFLLKNADIITVHIPLNPENKNFISRSKMLLIKDKTVFINTSRGEILDEDNLLKMLKNGKLYYAGLDVFKNEPDINKSFFGLKNVLLTNHIAGKTEDSKQYISNDIFMQVKKIFLYKQKKHQ
jgi:D-3-phosphoglycerate dehydrogenase / 2-oxoglutarate reductase